MIMTMCMCVITACGERCVRYLQVRLVIEALQTRMSSGAPLTVREAEEMVAAVEGIVRYCTALTFPSPH